MQHATLKFGAMFFFVYLKANSTPHQSTFNITFWQEVFNYILFTHRLKEVQTFGAHAKEIMARIE